MAEDKKGFILYADLIHTLEQLTDEQAGRLMKHILRYVNDENPETEDMITKIVFEPIKQQLKRDLEKWEKTKENYAKAGRASATARLHKSPQVYLIRCYNEEESFLKIGHCEQSLGRRFGNGENRNLPYKFEIIARFMTELITCIKIEGELHDQFLKHRYIPKKHFGGHMECYPTSIVNQIITKLTTFNDAENCLVLFENSLTSSTVNGNVKVSASANESVSKVDIYKPPIEFLHEQVGEVDMQVMAMQSTLPIEEFNFACTQWSLAKESEGWSCGEDKHEERKKLQAALQKWLNTWVRNFRNGQKNIRIQPTEKQKQTYNSGRYKAL